jgi:segregation and condensation protein A
MLPRDEYKVQLEVFEGPLDLLLYLIKKDELDIYDIPIERITAQYMEYLSVMRMLDLNIAGEFIVMAATLMMIKSRLLLPVEERPELEEEEDDPRWDLVRQLLEYKKFKEAASHLQEREYLQENVFTRGLEPAVPVEPDPGLVLGDVSLFDLIAAFNETLKRLKPEEFGEIVDDRFTVVDKIEFVLTSVKEHGKVVFSKLFAEAVTRPEIICTFLALLELIRLRQVTASQDQDFGEIVIVRTQTA